MSMPSRQKEGSTIIIISIVARRRADIVGFVNGLPLLFMELKNIHRNLRPRTSENLSDYKDTIPHLFHHNALIVLGNGEQAKHRLAHQPLRALPRMEAPGRGRAGRRWTWRRCSRASATSATSWTCSRTSFCSTTCRRGLVKIIAHNHQFLGVNRADRGGARSQDAAGQARRVLAHPGRRQVATRWRSSPARCTASSAATSRSWCSPTATTSTRRSTRPSPAAGWSTTTRTPAGRRAASTSSRLLTEHKAYVFSLIQKFNQNVDPGRALHAARRHHRHHRRGAPHAVRHAGAQHAQRPAERQLHRLHRHAALQGRRDHAPGVRRLRLDLRLPARGRGQRDRAALLRRPRREARRRRSATSTSGSPRSWKSWRPDSRRYRRRSSDWSRSSSATTTSSPPRSGSTRSRGISSSTTRPRGRPARRCWCASTRSPACGCTA